VDAALAAGAPVVQVRGKDLSDAELYELASRVTERCVEHGALCVVNDRPDVALAVEAGGVHVGAQDLPVAAARRLLGADRVVGATARDVETGRRHAAAGASYLGVGPAYATSTKAGLPLPLGPEGVGRVAAAVDLPVIAVAGVTAQRVEALLAAGAHGVAVVGAVSEADDPARATAALLAALEAGVAA
jgi:thiamine-phosphate pyrophosphorylase